MPHDIMLPFYGRPDHLRIAVASVLAQTDPDWRLVVIDDHYPDESAWTWLQGLDDPRVHVRRHTSNRGINATFQECVERSSAEWVTIFGCDDVMDPRYLEGVRRLVRTNPGATMVHPSTRIIDGDGNEVRTLVDSAKAWYRPHGRGVHVLTGEELAVSVTRGNWMNFPAVAWRGEELRAVGFRPNLNVVQDLALVVDLCEAGGSLAVENADPTFSYRRHAASVSSWRAVDGSRFAEEQAFFRALAERFGRRGWRRAARAARWHVSSRVNAASQLPRALKARDLSGARVLTRHLGGLTLRG
ncbi:glycosyltransferase family 2 protein [Miniimonas arenae]|uniref:glycosyltransferase family 2 protein n=1 Tax=Miniimonas arenae TaxID=676201 RepID=UPI0028AFE677|nr:glycosyltransferase family 2 protein [Miniimonas arenae]